MEVSENKDVKKSRRQSLAERMKGRYPEKDFTDDEALYGQINDDYDDFDRQISEYQGREKALNDMFSSDPRSATFLTEWRNGEDPVVALVRQFGTDIKDAIDDPEKLEDIAKANKEFVERVAKEKELEETYKSNLSASMSALDALQQERGLTDEQTDGIVDFLVRIVGDGIQGKFSRESYEMALNAINHDLDVATAAEEGEVRGKNAKVEATLRKRAKGDGTVALDGSNGSPAPRVRQSLGALDKFDDATSTIWERGGEKRRSSRD